MSDDPADLRRHYDRDVLLEADADPERHDEHRAERQNRLLQDLAA